MGEKQSVQTRWLPALRWAALGMCVVGICVSVAVLVLPWVLVSGGLRTWGPVVDALRIPGLVLIVAGVALGVGLLVVAALPRPDGTGSASYARWGLAWLCLSALTYVVVGALGYDRFAFVPAFAMLGLLPVLTCRSTGARVAWGIAGAAAAWWSISLASAPMQGGEKFAGVGVIIGLGALAALQFAFAVAGLLRAAFRRQ